MSSTQKVGIYSGTFDPIHDGHLSFAREAVRQCGLERIFFLIEPRPRKKQGVKALLHRQYMVHLAIAEEPTFGSIMLEQERYNVAETMPVLHERFKGADLFLLMGDDVLTHLSDWPNADNLLGSVHFVIGVRSKTPEAVKRHIKLLEKTRGVNINYSVLTAPLSNITSTQIRSVIKSGKEPVGVSPAVLAYIRAQNLYASSGESA